MLKGRSALVTGSTNGLGFAIAEGLARAGCNILLTGLEPAAGCCFSGQGCGASGVCAEASAGTAKTAKIARIREITAYKPVGRWLNNP